MANIKSQIKRNRQNEAARLRNKSVKSTLKTAVRRFREAADAGDAAKANENARVAARLLDKAASKGVIHANQAANRKSSIFKKAASLWSRPDDRPTRPADRADRFCVPKPGTQLAAAPAACGGDGGSYVVEVSGGRGRG